MKIRFVFVALLVLIALPFSVHADDITPPVVTAPVDQTFATTTIPAFPSLIPATATDDTDPSPVVAYTPQSFSLGTTTVIWTATDTAGNVATITSQVGIYSPAPVETATIKIYVGTTLATSAVVILPTSGSPDVNLTPTGSGTPHTAPARSAIAILASLDAQTDDFDVTQLDYYSGLGFQVSCVSIPSSTSTPLCTLFPPSWLFAVNGSAPTVGMSAVDLGDGDVMQLYYSYASSRQAVIVTPSVVTGSPFTVEARELDPATGTYHAATGFTIDLGTVSGFTFTTLQSSLIDSNGKAIFTLNATGTYAVALQEDYDFPSTSFVVNEPAAPSNSGGGGGGTVHFQLNVPTALAYLTSQQKSDGSFSSPLYSDWAALAFAASDAGTATTNLHDYLAASTPALSSATDYERHAMALMTLGINPYSGTSVDYIARIVGAFDGTQIGDKSLDNDDIFAFFPLMRAGYTTSDDIITKTVAFIVSRQTPSGSWDGSVDVTAAAIQALSLVPSLPNVSTALTNAEGYLRSQQQANGGFGNSFSTSWALQAIAALGQLPSSWMPSGLTPNDYLASLQQTDGSIEPTASSAANRVWATAYAIPASMGKTWSSLLSSFARPTGSTNNSSSLTTVLTATSTTPFATSTPLMATSTAEIIATSTPFVQTETTLTLSTTSTSSTKITTTKPQPKAKVLAPKIVQIPTQPATTPATTPKNQTAAAANAGGGFLTSLWNSITSFFYHLF